MSISTDKITAALNNGFNIICATCTHLHDAIEVKAPSCTKLSCGGPVYGKTFPEYNGIIPRAKFAAICVTCGTPNITHTIVIEGKPSFGLCSEHLNVIDNAINSSHIKNNSTSNKLVKPLIAAIGGFDV